MAHVWPLGAGDVATAVAAGVTQVAVGALRKDWELATETRAEVGSVGGRRREGNIERRRAETAVT